MLAAIFTQPGWWGFLGAFVYAGPKVLACVFEHRDGTRHPLIFCILEFIVALAVGVLAAEMFGPWIIGFLKLDGHASLRAIAGLIGLLANPLSPEVVKGFKGRIGGMIKGAGK